MTLETLELDKSNRRLVYQRGYFIKRFEPTECAEEPILSRTKEITNMNKLEIATAVYLFFCLVRIDVSADEVEARLNAAEVEFKSALNVIAEDVGKGLAEQEEVARRTGDLKKLREVESYRQDFDKQGVLPASLPKRVFDKNDSAIARLRRDFKEAINICMRNRDDGKIVEIEQRLDQMLDTAYQVMDIGIVARGSVWKGKDYIIGWTMSWDMEGR